MTPLLTAAVSRQISKMPGTAGSKILTLIVPSEVSVLGPVDLPAPVDPAKRLLVFLDLRGKVARIPVLVALGVEVGPPFISAIDCHREFADKLGRIAIRGAVVLAGVVEVIGLGRAWVRAIDIFVVIKGDGRVGGQIRLWVAS